MKVGSIYLSKDHPVYAKFDDNGNIVDTFDQISIDRTVFIGIAISIIIGTALVPIFAWVLEKL